MCMKIGVMDSGIGGLTILESLLKNCPNHEYIYFGDTYNLPYGEKTKNELINCANKVISFLEKENVDIIVVACGTVSSNIKYVKSNVPLIDIISPLKDMLDNYNLISIIATPLSIKTNAFQKYINTKLNLIATPLLVPIIEGNIKKDVNKVLKEYLERAKGSDALILGCTHYPIIKDEIKKIYKGEIITLDKFIIEKINKLKGNKSSLKIYYSKLNESIINNTYKILKRDKLIIERVCLNDK